MIRRAVPSLSASLSASLVSLQCRALSTATANANKPIAAVIGGSGLQGGSVARALLADGRYRVRVISRQAASAAAGPEPLRLLAVQGAELVQANINDPRSLRKAFGGAHAVFAVTNSYDPETSGGGKDADGEVRQGRAMADAAAAENVKQFVFSSLVNTKTISKGRIHVKHFDDKALVEDYVRQLGSKLPSAFVQPGFYAQNWARFMPLKKGPDGVVTFAMPVRSDVALPVVDITDTGAAVSRMLGDWNTFQGQTVRLAGEYITGPAMAATYSRVTNQPTRWIQIDLAQVPPAMAEMFKWFSEYGYYGGACLSDTQKHFPNLNTFEAFLRSSKLQAQ